MTFGISSWFFQELTVADALRKISAIGYPAAEIWMEHLNRTEEEPDSLRKLATDLGLVLTLHAPSYDLNPASLNPGIRDESLRQIEGSIEMAARLEARCVVVHPGHLSTARADRNECRDRIELMFDRVDEWAQSAGVAVGIEAMERRPLEVYMLPEHIAEMLGRPRHRTGLTFDVAHAFTHMDPVAFIEAIDPKWIVHVHLSDGDESATHRPLGRGNINISAALAALRRVYDGTVSIEGYVSGQGEETARANFDYLGRRHLL